MKKNVMMRVASALLVAVLMTTCAISGTFAKYTTSDSATDSARVAKWGVTVEVTGDDAFATKYNDAATDSGVKVVSTEKVVAPGTNGTLGTLSIAGQPEVMVDITVEVDLELTGWEIDTGEYCPIVFSVDGYNYSMTGTVAELENAVETAVKNKFKTFTEADVAANTNLDSYCEITWKWAYEGDNVKDTALGNLATAPEISFTCSVEVTQVD